MKTIHQQKPVRISLFMAFALILTLGLSLTSCRENALDNLSPEDSQVFITNYDRSVNFGAFRTYSLPDSMVVLSNNRVGSSLVPLEQRFIDRLASALTNRGYRRVERGQPADLGVVAIRVNDQFTGVTTNPFFFDYWYGPGFGGFGPGFGFGPGAGFGGFGGFVGSPYSVYQVSEQYWAINMVDLKKAPANTGGQQQLPTIFEARIRGNDIFSETSVDRAIEAIFAQSPYLQATR